MFKFKELLKIGWFSSENQIHSEASGCFIEAEKRFNLDL